MQRNLRIYLLHFFLNFLCGAFFCFRRFLDSEVIHPMAITLREPISGPNRHVLSYGIFLNILIATIIVNIVSFINFKESKCDPIISFVIYLILAYIGFRMPNFLFQVSLKYL